MADKPKFSLYIVEMPEGKYRLALIEGHEPTLLHSEPDTDYHFIRKQGESLAKHLDLELVDRAMGRGSV